MEESESESELAERWQRERPAAAREEPECFGDGDLLESESESESLVSEWPPAITTAEKKQRIALENTHLSNFAMQYNHIICRRDTYMQQYKDEI